MSGSQLITQPLIQFSKPDAYESAVGQKKGIQLIIVFLIFKYFFL